MNINTFLNRAKYLIISPQTEWVKIDSENTTRQEIMKGYVIPFVVLIAICTILGNFLFSLHSLPLNVLLVKVIISGVLLIGVIYLSVIIINELTNSFGINKNPDAISKLLIYSLNSFFITSCLIGFLPDFQVLMILGLHSVYLIWLGYAHLLKAPEANRIGFVIVSFLIIIGIFAIYKLIVDTIEDGMLYITHSL
jgi:hypothetical protein